MRCPGQDPRYWTQDAVFDASCPKCGTAVEFFKDEASGRCPSCGHRFRNPKVSFDCAKWCAYAEECLGFVPESVSPPDPGGGALASRLIQAVKAEFETDPARVARPLLVFQHARELLSQEGGDPRIILAAALLLDVGREDPGTSGEALRREPDETDRLVRVRRILEHAGLDDATIACVCRILDRRGTGEPLDSIEFQVVSDADTLARLSAENPAADLDKRREVVENGLRTVTGKARARRLLSAPRGDRNG